MEVRRTNGPKLRAEHVEIEQKGCNQMSRFMQDYPGRKRSQKSAERGKAFQPYTLEDQPYPGGAEQPRCKPDRHGKKQQIPGKFRLGLAGL